MEPFLSFLHELEHNSTNMLHIIPIGSEEKKGTCAACREPITTKDYWRCLDAVCGDEKGSGRVCGDCYAQIQNKNQCPTCRRVLEDTAISDPKLLPAAVDANGPIPWMHKTMRNLILEGKHFDTVLDMAIRDARVLCPLATFAVSTWHSLSLEQLQLLFGKLETAIMYGLAVKPVNLWTVTVFEAVGKCDVSVVEWLIQWMEQRRIFHEVTPTTEIDADQEARLLSVCNTKQEFKALRRLLGGPCDDIIRGDVVEKYVDTKGEGQEWVMRAILSTAAITEDQDTAWRLLTKFPYPEMYQWAQKHRIVLGGPSEELALQYSIFPVVYGCHSKGLYSQSATLALMPFLFKDMHGYGHGHGCCTTFPAIHPDAKQRVLYVDLAHDTMRLDWHTVHDIKTLEATSKRVTVELCDDGVEIYLDSEQLLFPCDKPLKITGFNALALKQRNANKRKFLSI